MDDLGDCPEGLDNVFNASLDLAEVSLRDCAGAREDIGGRLLGSSFPVVELLKELSSGSLVEPSDAAEPRCWKVSEGNSSWWDGVASGSSGSASAYGSALTMKDTVVG